MPALMFAAAVVLGQAKTYTPKPKSPERQAIVDALRPKVEKDLKQKVIFVIQHFKVQNGWAFLFGRPTQPNGKPIDYTKTQFAEVKKEGMYDDNFSALLKSDGKKWKVVIYNLGATDVVWEPWPKQFKAPPAIFKM